MANQNLNKIFIILIVAVGMIFVILFHAYLNSNNAGEIEEIEESTSSNIDLSRPIVKQENQNSEINEESSDENKEKFTQMFGTGLDINNNNYKTYDGYSKKLESLIYANGAQIHYMVPEDWDENPVSGAEIYTSASKTSSFEEETYKETSYETVLENFKNHLKDRASFPNSVVFDTRYLDVNGTSFPIIVMQDGYTISNYMVLINGAYEFHMEITVASSNYTYDLIDVADKIFSTFYVSL